MASAFPLRPSVDHTPRTRSVVALGDGESDATLDALSSATAREIMQTLADGPATASDLAEAVDTSPQNIHYHLENLHEAGLVAHAGTWYSSKGREMRVYALASERLDLRFASADSTDRVEPANDGLDRPATPGALTGD